MRSNVHVHVAVRRTRNDVNILAFMFSPLIEARVPTPNTRRPTRWESFSPATRSIVIRHTLEGDLLLTEEPIARGGLEPVTK